MAVIEQLFPILNTLAVARFGAAIRTTCLTFVADASHFTFAAVEPKGFAVEDLVALAIADKLFPVCDARTVAGFRAVIGAFAAFTFALVPFAFDTIASVESKSLTVEGFKAFAISHECVPVFDTCAIAGLDASSGTFVGFAAILADAFFFTGAVVERKLLTVQDFVTNAVIEELLPGFHARGGATYLGGI